MSDYTDGTDARQFEQHLNRLVADSKHRMSQLVECHDSDTDVLRDELARLMALESCRHHALTADAELTETASAGYRIVNTYLGGNS